MAYIDKELELSDGQALTATGNSENVIDLGYDGADAGTGKQLFLVVRSNAAMGGTNPTINVTLQESDTENMASPRAVVSTGVVPGASFGAGTAIHLPIPPHAGRYLRVSYTLGGTSPTANVSANIQLDIQRWKAYEANTGTE